MQVKEEAARKLMRALGKPEENWNKRRLVTKLNALPELLEGAAEPEEKEDNALLVRIIKAVEEGDEIGLEEVGEASAPAASNGKSKKKGSNVKTSSKKTEKKAGPKAKKEGGATKTDKFGSRVGSSNALVNKALSSKPQSVGDIVAKTGLEPSKVRYAHLNDLVARKLVKKTAEGFVLA